VAEPHHGAFGQDAFGRRAESAARFFGTPGYIIGQTILVILWIGLNSVALAFEWDPYPFILLNLAFSTQAAYAAPLILLAETRHAERDRIREEREREHRDRIAERTLEKERELRALLQANTELTRRVETLAQEIHEALRR
jgi:uncharacterized membrane protein